MNTHRHICCTCGSGFVGEDLASVTKLMDRHIARTQHLKFRPLKDNEGMKAGSFEIA